MKEFWKKKKKRKYTLLTNFKLKSEFLVQMNFFCKIEFSFFSWPVYPITSWVGNYKEKLRHGANFREGGNRGGKKNVEITGWKFPGKYSCKGSPRPIKKADESGCTSFLGKEISNTSRSPPCAKNASVPPLFSRSTI